MRTTTYLVTVVAFAVFGFMVLFFLSNWLFQNWTMDLVSGLLGAVAAVALALLTGPERMRTWSW
jgi:uncharacterized membrane protein